MTVENLFKLAEIYGAGSIHNLTVHPSNKAVADAAAEAMRTVMELPDDRRQTWLALGRQLKDSLPGK